MARSRTIHQIVEAKFDDMDAFVNQTATAVARDDNLASTWVLRQQAGEAAGYLEAVAAHNPDGPPLSTFKIKYDFIDLDGQVSARDIVVTDFSGDLIPNGAFVHGDLRGWDRGPERVRALGAQPGRDGSARHRADQPCLADYRARRRAPGGDGRLCAGPSLGDPEPQLQIRHRRRAAGYLRRHGLPVVQGQWGHVRPGCVDVNHASSPDWETRFGQVTVPPQAARMRVLFRIFANNQGLGFFTDFELIRQRDGATLITPNSVTTREVNTQSLGAKEAWVGTLTLGANAVSGEAWSGQAGTTWVGSSAGWRSVRSVTMKRDKDSRAFIQICAQWFGNASGGNALAARIRRNNTTLIAFENEREDSAGYISKFWQDSASLAPDPGELYSTHTYHFDLWVEHAYGGLGITGVGIYVSELKR